MSETTNRQGSDEYTVSFRVLVGDFWRGCVKYWWVCALLVLLLAGIQFFRSFVRYTPLYEATATFAVHTENTKNGNNGEYTFNFKASTAGNLEKVFPELIKSKLLRKRVCADLGVAKMPATIQAECLPDTNMITLTSRGKDPQLTYDVLLSVVDNYSSVADYVIGRTQLMMITQPQVPVVPVNFNSWQRSVLKGVAAGLVLGFTWILLYALLRRTVRTKEDIRGALDQRCLGVIPQVVFKKYRKKINQDVFITNSFTGNAFLESVRLLRSSVNNNLHRGEKVILVTSTAPGEGKTNTAVNLAAMYSRNRQSALVMDCDLRNSGLTELFRERKKTLVGQVEGQYSVWHIEELNIDILRFDTRKNNSRRILHSSYLSAVLEQVRGRYDIVFMDTPACGLIADASVAAGVADGILYVIRQDEVLRSRICAGISSVTASGTRLVGCVLTGAYGGLGGYGSNYGYGYGYGYGSKYGYGAKKGS